MTQCRQQSGRERCCWAQISLEKCRTCAGRASQTGRNIRRGRRSVNGKYNSLAKRSVCRRRRGNGGDRSGQGVVELGVSGVAQCEGFLNVPPGNQCCSVQFCKAEVFGARDSVACLKRKRSSGDGSGRHLSLGTQERGRALGACKEHHQHGRSQGRQQCIAHVTKKLRERDYGRTWSRARPNAARVTAWSMVPTGVEPAVPLMNPTVMVTGTS